MIHQFGTRMAEVIEPTDMQPCRCISNGRKCKRHEQNPKVHHFGFLRVQRYFLIDEMRSPSPAFSMQAFAFGEKPFPRVSCTSPFPCLSNVPIRLPSIEGVKSSPVSVMSYAQDSSVKSTSSLCRCAVEIQTPPPIRRATRAATTAYLALVACPSSLISRPCKIHRNIQPSDPQRVLRACVAIASAAAQIHSRASRGAKSPLRPKRTIARSSQRML